MKTPREFVFEQMACGLDLTERDVEALVVAIEHRDAEFITDHAAIQAERDKAEEDLAMLRALLPNTTVIAAERDRLRAALEEARGALERISAYDTDWALGPGQNVAALQEISERAEAAIARILGKPST